MTSYVRQILVCENKTMASSKTVKMHKDISIYFLLFLHFCVYCLSQENLNVILYYFTDKLILQTNILAYFVF